MPAVTATRAGTGRRQRWPRPSCDLSRTLLPASRCACNLQRRAITGGHGGVFAAAASSRACCVRIRRAAKGLAAAASICNARPATCHLPPAACHLAPPSESTPAQPRDTCIGIRVRPASVAGLSLLLRCCFAAAALLPWRGELQALAVLACSRSLALRESASCVCDLVSSRRDSHSTSPSQSHGVRATSPQSEARSGPQARSSCTESSRASLTRHSRASLQIIHRDPVAVGVVGAVPPINWLRAAPGTAVVLSRTATSLEQGPSCLRHHGGYREFRPAQNDDKIHAASPAANTIPSMLVRPPWAPCTAGMCASGSIPRPSTSGRLKSKDESKAGDLGARGAQEPVLPLMFRRLTERVRRLASTQVY
ncbi:uncharacterized protein BDZ99DRAFT_501051 [Mytilinidion resinicola]|uniref:Uncharacterized protein n=1 Tax=Mytilinidion resinicola TaxID=574789 RepID=A0A6A6YE13_9PEZI|nr:uncharacterized protein BDZ99DRAFT_501051 [Mytilinidion resinicola]KAF2807061.1 hypothetical protein BDZ99DRAFT_501051 [Mytilinidion resinicola]